jgi:carboxyl-terminal processing protease
MSSLLLLLGFKEFCMKKWLLTAFAIFLSTQTILAISLNSSASQLKPQTPQTQAARLTAEVLSRYHYKPIKLNDISSNKIFDNYLKSLDSERIFFIQEDLDQFSYARTKLDNALLEEDLTIPFSIFNLYQQRVTQRIQYAKSLLKKPFNFEVKEQYQYVRDDVPWAKSNDELNEVWRKRVKNDWLRLKVAGKDDKSIVETLTKRYDNSITSINKIKSDDVFQSFMNAYAMVIDPHTNYFGVRAAEDFNISMRLSLVGIGAVLQDKDEYTVIRELVTGGPAALSGKLKVGDRIVGVAQGETSPMIEVMGWRLDDTVDLIRGAEGSMVVLDILPADAGLDGKHKRIILTRKKINLEQQAAKKSIIEVKDGSLTHKIGIIALPVFYQDFAAKQSGDKNFRSATRDVTRLVEELKKEQVDSLLIDLRNNGGGSLDEAIELTGLFINQGPVLQERDVEGTIKVDSDTNQGAIWTGPMGVLINRGSASASEIFAAAIQDYGRGLIIGELSYGKGTVQTVINLDKIARNETPKFGEIKMTVAQFFRINGGTTQLRGVVPDINLPAMTDLKSFGESSFDNALPWTNIKPAEFSPLYDYKPILPKLVKSHETRISQNQDFQFLNQDIQEFNAQLKKNAITLNEAERRKERTVQEARIAEREKSGEPSKPGLKAALQDDGLQANERNLKSELSSEKDNKNEKDILLNEAANILSDAINLIDQNNKQTASISQK